MSVQYYGFYFSCNADSSANDKTVYVELLRDGNAVRLGARYKNSEPNHLYEIEMDSNDLRMFGEMCIDLSTKMRLAESLSRSA